MFDAKAEVERLANISKSRRKKLYGQSRLDRYKYEILALKNNGASFTHVQIWLREKRIKVALNTVIRWCQKHG